MKRKPIFPTPEHLQVAKLVNEYFGSLQHIDTVLVVNSCARGKAVPESDLGFAILVKPGTIPALIKETASAWQAEVEKQPACLQYKKLHPYAHLHLDMIDGVYTPGMIEDGGAPDYFEIEIGNHICYSAPMREAGPYFTELQKKWLPYYDEKLRLKRLAMTRNACAHDLDHVRLYMKRELYFQAFDRLYIAFQKFLQALFIAKKTYPIAYNKWIKEQIEIWLGMPELYPKLSPIISVSNIESDEIHEKIKMLDELLHEYKIEY
jgi:hypothetical protein